jgi:hypothetical protein
VITRVDWPSYNPPSFAFVCDDSEIVDITEIGFDVVGDVQSPKQRETIRIAIRREASRRKLMVPADADAARDADIHLLTRE